MDEIMQSLRKAETIMDDIANATREQASGIEQITLAVGQLDAITQKNAIQVEESAKATLLQQEQAGNLAKTITQFRLEVLTHQVCIGKVARQSANTSDHNYTETAACIQQQPGYSLS